MVSYDSLLILIVQSCSTDSSMPSSVKSHQIKPFRFVLLLLLLLFLQAVNFLNDKNGVSLSSIRKWILAKYPETKDKQKASFNSLTIKASKK